MKAKFQIGDFVRLKRGDHKGQLAEVTKVYWCSDRCEYLVKFRSDSHTDLRYSYDLDKADAPITAEDLRKFGYTPIGGSRQYKNTSIAHFYPAHNLKELGNRQTKRGFERIVLETTQDPQGNIINTFCMIDFYRGVPCGPWHAPTEEPRKDAMGNIMVRATINTVSELRKIMSFIQSI